MGVDDNFNNCCSYSCYLYNCKSDHHKFYSNGITAATAAVTAAIKAATDTTV